MNALTALGTLSPLNPDNRGNRRKPQRPTPSDTNSIVLKNLFSVRFRTTCREKNFDCSISTGNYGSWNELLHAGPDGCEVVANIMLLRDSSSSRHCRYLRW